MNVIFVSREKIRNPHVEEIKSTAERISSMGTISVRYGNRVLMASSINLAKFREEDVVEIVDYNISTDTALVIGIKCPSEFLPLHWMLYRIPGINASIHTHRMLNERLSIEDFLSALKNLKKEKFIHNDIFGKISIGRTLKEALDIYQNI